MDPPWRANVQGGSNENCAFVKIRTPIGYRARVIIEVAPILRSERAEVDLPGDIASRAALGMRWSERRPVRLDAAEDTKAVDVLIEAAEVFGLDTSPRAWGWP